MKKEFFFAAICIALSSCSPKISTTVSKQLAPLDYKQDVVVYDLNESTPTNSFEIGTVKIGDSGFTANCGWDVVLEEAKLEARKMGGNAIKITDHRYPNPMGSSCHRITANVLKLDSTTSCKQIQETLDSTMLKADYALIHLFRPGGAGSLINYDVHLGDSIIWTSSNNAKKTIRIKKDGLNSLWASTEAKSEIPITIKIGQEYYVRCSITFGAFVGRPQLELVEDKSGKMEYGSLKMKNSKIRDYIILKNGKEIACRINNEDSDCVYIQQLNDSSENAVISKNTIQYIQKAD